MKQSHIVFKLLADGYSRPEKALPIEYM